MAGSDGVRHLKWSDETLWRQTLLGFHVGLMVGIAISFLVRP